MKRLLLSVCFLCISAVAYATCQDDDGYKCYPINDYSRSPKGDCLEMACEHGCVENSEFEGHCCEAPKEGTDCRVDVYKDGCLIEAKKVCPDNQVCNAEGNCESTCVPLYVNRNYKAQVNGSPCCDNLITGIPNVLFYGWKAEDGKRYGCCPKDRTYGQTCCKTTQKVLPTGCCDKVYTEGGEEKCCPTDVRQLPKYDESCNTVCGCSSFGGVKLECSAGNNKCICPQAYDWSSGDEKCCLKDKLYEKDGQTKCCSGTVNPEKTACCEGETPIWDANLNKCRCDGPETFTLDGHKKGHCKDSRNKAIGYTNPYACAYRGEIRGTCKGQTAFFCKGETTRSCPGGNKMNESDSLGFYNCSKNSYNQYWGQKKGESAASWSNIGFDGFTFELRKKESFNFQVYTNEGTCDSDVDVIFTRID